MRLLGIETATDECSVALAVGGEIREASAIGNRHSESILPLIDRLLAEAGITTSDLDAIAVGEGPGSFTALRIGAGVAQGIALARGIPVIPVSSLMALAAGVSGEEVLAVLDARMGQVYYGFFRRAGRRTGGRLAAVGGEGLARPESMPVPEGSRWIGAGPGFAAYGLALRQRLGEALEGEVFEKTLPTGRACIEIALGELSGGFAGCHPAVALPRYLRDDVAARPAALGPNSRA